MVHLSHDQTQLASEQPTSNPAIAERRRPRDSVYQTSDESGDNHSNYEGKEAEKPQYYIIKAWRLQLTHYFIYNY